MTQPELNFTGRDYSAELERLDALQIAEVPELTDLNHSDAGKVLKRLVARESDQNNAYIDRVAEEGFIATFRFKQSGVDLGGLVGYLPTLAASASTRLRLDRLEAGATISIPKYSAFGRSDGLTYLTAEAAEIAESEQSVEVNAIQGELRTEDIEPTDWQTTDWSGRPRYLLPKGLAAGTVELWSSAGDPPVLTYWSEVDSFWRSLSTDRHFLLELNGDTDQVWLVLGDGVQGMGPPSAENLHIRYVVCGEASGNCGSGVIYLVPDELSDSVTCSNIESATGGAAAESTESIRRMIPRVVRTQRRGVIKEDYEALIEHMSGVLHVQALDRNDYRQDAGATSSPVWPHLYVALYVVPDGGGPMSSLLKDEIWAQCGLWGHLGSWKERYILLDAVEVPINVAIRAGILPGYSADAVRSAVIFAVSAVLAPENRTIGGVVTFTELHNAASAVAGVSWVEFDSPTGNVEMEAGQIAVPGSVNVTIT